MNLISPRTITGHLSAGLGLLALTLVWGQPAISSDADTLCWRDYPIPTTSVNYEKAFTSETLAPDRISINGKVLRLGVTENDLNSVLGVTSIVVEDWQQRDEQRQCNYLLELLRDHPNSMHLYKLGQLKLKRMSGLFRASEWQLPGVGKLRAFFSKSSAGKFEASYLYYLTPIPTSLNNVKRKQGVGYVLIRTGVSKIQWDVQTNSITISTHGDGG
jgi:hypothetical protein